MNDEQFIPTTMDSPVTRFPVFLHRHFGADPVLTQKQVLEWYDLYTWKHNGMFDFRHHFGQLLAGYARLHTDGDKAVTEFLEGAFNYCFRGFP
jgi:hypothetical protein